ncbi:MAG: hypothetical protein C0402_09395 [Thermodesulfovibrio sp.]|nr:hypothetical protein [Thermodesulfovibrio sp.]
MKKRLIITLLATIFIMGTLSSSYAVSSYLSSFSSTYPASGSSSFSCSLCHTNVPTRNAYGAAYGSGHNFNTIASQDSDGDGFTNLAEITAGTNPGDAASKPAAPAACTSYTYSAWSACQANNTQTRTVATKSPAGCTGNPAASLLTQACVYVPPVTACTSYTYSAWSACQANNTQTRTVATKSPAGCTGNPAASLLTQACVYVPPVTACTSFTYSGWSACQTNNTQTRSVVSSLPAGCTGGTPLLTQICNYVPPVTACTSFTYSGWSACQANNTQTRSVVSSLPAGCTGGTPLTSQACNYVPPTPGNPRLISPASSGLYWDNVNQVMIIGGTAGD